jgi:acyl-CoA dehydrogenase
MTAIAMTEPGAGSDLANIATTAKLSNDGTHYVVNGAKTSITGGATADLILTFCRTAPFCPDNRRAGLSILCARTDSEGFSVGRTLDKIGLHQQDTVELSYTDARVPAENLLGIEGEAFSYLTHNLPQERLSIALNSVAHAEAAILHATNYVASGRSSASRWRRSRTRSSCLPNAPPRRRAPWCSSATPSSCSTQGELTVADAARAKRLSTEVAGRVIDKCLQLHGGYGCITEYPIARLYTDSRVTGIYGGTSEVMKTIIAKDLGL